MKSHKAATDSDAEVQNQAADIPKAEHKLYCCLRFPQLAIRNIRFQSGFLLSESAEEQAIVEQSGEFGLTLWNVTQAINQELSLSETKRIYFSSEPSLVLNHVVRFHPLLDGPGVFASDNPDHHFIIDQSGLLRTGAVREVPLLNRLNALAGQA